jgi:hypothetical protein
LESVSRARSARIDSGRTYTNKTQAMVNAAAGAATVYDGIIVISWTAVINGQGLQTYPGIDASSWCHSFYVFELKALKLRSSEMSDSRNLLVHPSRERRERRERRKRH